MIYISDGAEAGGASLSQKMMLTLLDNLQAEPCATELTVSYDVETDTLM